jgi:hypothetical protein
MRSPEKDWPGQWLLRSAWGSEEARILRRGSRCIKMKFLPPFIYSDFKEPAAGFPSRVQRAIYIERQATHAEYGSRQERRTFTLKFFWRYFYTLLAGLHAAGLDPETLFNCAGSGCLRFGKDRHWRIGPGTPVFFLVGKLRRGIAECRPKHCSDPSGAGNSSNLRPPNLSEGCPNCRTC